MTIHPCKVKIYQLFKEVMFYKEDCFLRLTES